MKTLPALCLILILSVFNSYGQTNYSWNGSMSSAWSDPLNWTPNGLPSATDNITLNALGNSPLLDDSVAYNNVTITAGTPDLGGYTLYVTGNLVLSGGTISNGLLRVNAAAAKTATLSAVTTASTCTLNIVTGAITVNGGTYSGPVSIEQIGAVQTTGAGGATFHNALTLVNSGTSNIRMNGNVTYNGPVTFETRNTGYILPELTTGSTYNNTLTCNLYGTGNIRLAYLGTNTFNGNISFNSTSNGNVYFGEQAAATATLSAGNTLSTGTFTIGRIYLYRFTQLGGTAQNLTLTGTAYFTAGPAATFNGDVTVSSPQLSLNGATYNSKATFTKTGAGNNTSTGANTFNGTTIITNSGTGSLTLSNTTRDIYNGDLALSSDNTGVLYVANNDATGTQFNGNVTVSSTAASGIRFCQGTGTARLASGKLLSIGAGGFSAGSLYIRNFTQTGNESLTLNTFTGTVALYLQTGSVFNGDVDFSAPQLFLNGATYNAGATLTKTGATNNVSTGGNTYNGITTISQNGTGYLLLSNTTRDIFNQDVTFQNGGAGILYVAHNDATGTQFNGNVIVNGSAAGGIRFGQSAGTCTLASGKTITIGTGFSAGSLYLRNFTQVGATSQVLNSFTGTTALYLQAGTTFNGSVDFAAPQLLLNGATFNNTALIVKNGATTNNGTGNNRFNASTEIRATGAGILGLGNGTGDVFNDDVTFTNTGVGINISIATGATQFNGNVVVNSTGTGGVQFGQAAATSGSCTLAAGNTITIGPSGFNNSGTLRMRSFTQAGSTTQSLTLTGTASLIVGPASTFNADVTFVAPQLFLNGTTFNGVADLQKSGATNNVSTGNNIFNGAVTVRNSGTGSFTMAGTTGDDYNSDAEFIQTGAGALYPAASTSSTFAGNISTSLSSVAVIFGQNANGRVVIDGNTTQAISGSVALKPIIRRLQMSTAGTLTLNVPVDVSTDLNLVSGIINTTSSNILTMTDESATANIGSASAYVNGPMNYVMNLSGTATLNFPVGKGGDWRPMEFTPTHNSVTAYTYTTEMLNASAEALGYLPLPVSIDKVSDVRYWQMNRSPSINANLTTASARFYYGSSGNDDKVTDPANLTVVKTVGAGTVWNDIGGTASGTGTGTIVSSGITSSGLFAFGNLVGGSNPLPVTLLTFNAVANGKLVNLNWSTASEQNNDYFSVEHSSNGADFTEFIKVDGAGNSNSVKYYTTVDHQPFSGISYYRLKQVDFNGTFTYSKIVSVVFNSNQDVQVYPNPVVDKAHIELESSNGSDARLALSDASGKVVNTSVASTTKGHSVINYDMTQIPAGAYWLTISLDDARYTIRIMKAK